MIRLGVNIDHVATIREARKGVYPDPVAAAIAAEQAGADNITCHLREDRRHIQDADLIRLKQALCIPLNLEIAATDEMIAIACDLQPRTVTLVPERRQELTTERGLDAEFFETLEKPVKTLQEQDIGVCLFVDAVPSAVALAARLGVMAVEFHTGPFCMALNNRMTTKERLGVVEELAGICRQAEEAELQVHVGHGLNFQNAAWLQLIPAIEEANIGHSLVSCAIFSGLSATVARMRQHLNDPQFRPTHNDYCKE